MRLVIFFIFCLFGVLQYAAAQNIVRATVLDEAAQPLPFAAVSLLHLPDSMIVAQGQTNESGDIRLTSDRAKDNCLLQITYVGYEFFNKEIMVAGNKHDTLDLGALKMTPLSKMLQEATVTATREAVQIKGDTMLFDAKSYQTQPNAVAGDLIKKLPGVELEKDGTVKAQGEDVQQILVNGKPFFGNDIQIALQNLPADAIEGVEIYDKKSDQAAFTGIDDGVRRKTINIKLKQNLKKTQSGKLTGGYGTDDRYLSRLNFNRFSEKQNITVLGSANNINRTGFAQEDFSAFTGQNRRGGGNINTPQQNQNASKGFQNTQSGGVNYTDMLTSKTDLALSYFYNNQNTLNDRLVNRQNFLPSGTYFTHANAVTETQNRNHRINATLDQKIDTFTSFRFAMSGSFTENSTENTSQSQNLKGDTLLQNQQKRHSLTEGDGFGGSTFLLFRRRLSKAGRTASVNLAYSRNTSERDVALQSQVNYFNSSGTAYRNDTIDQTDARNNRRNDYSTTFSYTEPLSKKVILEGNYKIGQADNYANRDVYNIKNGEIQNLNAELSNLYNNTFSYHRVGTNLRILGGQKYNFSTGVQYQNSLLKGEFITRQFDLTRRFDYFLPNIRYDYNFSRQTRLNFAYETNVNEPTIDQMQPVRDNSDPINLYIGNQNLVPEYGHNLRLRYSNVNKKTLAYFNANMNGAYTLNKIANMMTVDSLFRRVTQPINTPSAYNADGHLGYGFRFWRQRMRVNWATNGSVSRGTSFINGVENINNRYNASTSFRAEFQMPDTFELSLRAVVRYSKTDYSFQTNLSQWYWTYNYEAEMTVALPLSTRLNSTFDYSFLNGKTFGKTPGIPLLSVALTHYFDKKRTMELRLTVVDVLNRNTGINRTADANYVQEEIVRSLGRYGLLTFTYSLNPKINKGKNTGEGRRRKAEE
ncbi:MAG: outer membrane beta-barrel protein [Saprospiraceae bacterium]|nr:outer membrane beta-barrel protein [Saprospiraceae bacterium]